MDENKNNTNVGAENVVTTNDDKTQVTEITYNQADVDAKIQSECDKLRTKYSKQIKELQSKITELSPVQKTESEIALEKRLADLETKQNEIAEKEKYLNLQGALQAKNINAGIADYLKSDIDIVKFSEAIEKIVNDKIKSSGYVPNGHQPNVGMTKEEWNKLGYTKKAELYKSNPELYKTFI